MTHKLTTGNGTKILVDAEDLPELLTYCWNVATCGYAYAANWKNNNKRIAMHRLLMGVTDSNLTVDHINGDKLDNRKSNLRVCTLAQNHSNKGKGKTNTSGYKGVTLHKQTNTWCAKIYVNGRSICIGYYKDKVRAAIAYNKAAVEYNGEYAHQNPIDYGLLTAKELGK